MSELTPDRSVPGRPITTGVDSGGGGFTPYFNRQVREMGEGAFHALLRKGRRLLVVALAALSVLVLRALRLLVVIRFGQLKSHAFGHLAGNPELYLCERDLGMHPPRTVDIFYYSQYVANEQLRKMWERVLWVSQFAGVVDSLNRRLPGYERHVIPMQVNAMDLHGVLARTRAHLSFTAKEERTGQEGLRKLGIPDGSPFVCFSARDPAYHYAVRRGPKSFHYARIQTYVPAAEDLARRGYFVLRMGAVVTEPLATPSPMIIDYATHGRTDFLDIFLGAKCHFFIGHDGLIFLPMIFRRPVAFVNLPLLEFVPSWGGPKDLFIPKKLWLRAERRFMTFLEVLHSGAGKPRFPYDQHGIEIVDNTPEEITALVLEMEERLKGTWSTTEEDENLQRRFWSLWKPNVEVHGVCASRIGAEFLRQNRDLLG